MTTYRVFTGGNSIDIQADGYALDHPYNGGSYVARFTLDSGRRTVATVAGDFLIVQVST